MLSVIVPVHNGQHYLESVVQQLLAEQLVSFEIIFVDNNSTDKTWAILLKLANQYNFVQILKEDKLGASAARNRGYLAAKGEFIYFFDVDDLLIQGSLVKMQNLLVLHPEAACVYGNRIVVKNRHECLKIEKEVSYALEKPPTCGLMWFKNFSLLSGPPAFMHRRCKLEKWGLFPEHMRIGEDAFFHIRLGLNEKMIHLKTPVYMYYRHLESTVTKNNKLSSRTSIYWKQYINTYLPYYFQEKTPLVFDMLLFRKIQGSYLKLLLEPNKIRNRYRLFKRLEMEILPLRVSFYFKCLAVLLILTGSTKMYKLCVYYLLSKKSLKNES
ncbi:glycosyltransferase family 2 protein [Mesonia sp. K4-1]|uniref:glycosyltransferase family 2 protein n=1 Tax=Mesonia sp. K4-1 TaxID=2602760 RepID=UPI00164FA08C|nr:glycosyltransferase family 2 protein [Mesonia sp. K4-1]